MATSLAPSWHETTLDWIRQECPQYLGARGTPVQKLTGALRKASYLLTEAKHDRKMHDAVLALEVGEWDLARHNRFRAWIEAGGYTAPAHVPTGTDPVTGLPTLVIDTPDGPESITLDMDDNDALAKLQPPAQHVQTVEEAVAHQELQDDERYGSW